MQIGIKTTIPGRPLADLALVRPAPPTPSVRAAPVIGDLREMTADNDPGSANISLKGGKAKMSYWWNSTTAADFENVAILILGAAGADYTARTDPGVLRKMPVAHPRFPSLYAEAVTDFTGIGAAFVKEAGNTPFNGITTVPQYARYPTYRVDVEFANRFYAVATDASVRPAVSLSWSDDTGTGAAVARKCWDTQEYKRWTWVSGGPKENFVTAKAGQAGIDVGGTTKLFNDQPRLALPDGAVVIKWFEVPFSFVRPSAPVAGASWFQLYQGRVNQTAFFNWGPGELLYVTISPRPYATPLPDGNGYLIMLCDIDILCMETKRLLSAADPAPGPALANWIAAGWNLQPFWLDRQFHYTHSHQGAGGTVLPANQQAPFFRSFPMQILFSNPEVALPP